MKWLKTLGKKLFRGFDRKLAGVPEAATLPGSKKLIVAYRNNPLFRKYLPSILDSLQTIAVKRIVYPESTSREEIDTRVERELFDEPGPFAFACDRTCSSWRGKPRNAERISRALWIDELFGTAASKFLGGRDFAENLTLVTRLTLEEPKRIFIVRDSLADHVNSEEFYRRPNRFAREIKRILTAIYPMAVVSEVDSLDSPEFTNDAPDDLIIVDRHHRYQGEYRNVSWTRQASVVTLPLEEAIEDLILQGKVEGVFDPAAEFSQAFQKLLAS
jgi:hypothetical protein